MKCIKCGGKLNESDKFCPSCYKNLTMFSASLKYNYCPNCGQRLDWSDNLER